MEVRQLRYFVAVAEELHFGRAAQREHIVQSALSQQIFRLERDIGVRLLVRDTHQVQLSPAGAAFLLEARQLLVGFERAATMARRAAQEPQVLRMGMTDPSSELTPLIIDRVQTDHPDIEVHQLEAAVSQQYDMLAAGQLDVGVGCATFAPDYIASQLFRRDRMGVLLSEQHPLAHENAVSVRDLEPEPLLFGPPGRIPEHDKLMRDMCLDVGFTPTVYRGSVQSVLAGVGLVRVLRCAMCVPQSVWQESPGVRWVPLTEPAVTYPWSVLWRADEPSTVVRSFVSWARQLSTALGWVAADTNAIAHHGN